MKTFKSVLLVDDSKVFLRVVQDQIKDQMEILGVAHDGESGFEMYKKLKPDVVLLDITMPNCSGKECLRKILEFDPAAAVIMASSVGDEGTIQECLQLGAKAFIKKETVSARHTPLESIVLSKLIEIMGKTKASEAA